MITITFLIPIVKPLHLVMAQTIYPSSIELNASKNFYLAHQYTSETNNHMKVSENATETEPPKMENPLDESEFSPEKYVSLYQHAGEINQTRAVTMYPYHRFDVTVDKDVKPSDKVTVFWEGRSLPDRHVTMYGWNIEKEEWVALDHKIAGNRDFSLKGTISANDYVRDSKITIIVQDQLSPTSKSYDYSFVWMSDTQYYAQDHPEVFKSMVEWIAQNKTVMNISYVFHTGDIVNRGKDQQQWKRADSYINTLDVAKIPYGVLPGNHDKGDNYKQYQHYFGKKRFRYKDYYGGSYQNNRGHFDLISRNGKDYVFVYMGWDVDKEAIVWMNKVLSRYSDRTAILVFHEYLEEDGKRSHKGNELFDKVVIPNKNVVAVLCGHYHSSEVLINEIDDNSDGVNDRSVYQILADYQKAPNGGNGFIRLLHIDEETNSIDVQTYSPYVDKYHFYDPTEYPNKDEFTMDINVKKTVKMIATNYFELNVYKRMTSEKVANSEN